MISVTFDMAGDSFAALREGVERLWNWRWLFTSMSDGRGSSAVLKNVEMSMRMVGKFERWRSVPELALSWHICHDRGTVILSPVHNHCTPVAHSDAGMSFGICIRA